MSERKIQLEESDSEDSEAKEEKRPFPQLIIDDDDPSSSSDDEDPPHPPRYTRSQVHGPITVRECRQCNAVNKNLRRCRRITCKYADKCAQHTIRDTGLEIRPSRLGRDAGMGLFARRKFKGPVWKKNKHGIKYQAKPGEVICRYSVGERYIVDNREVPEDEEYHSCYGYEWKKNYVVDAASTQSGLGRWANTCTEAKNGKKCKQNARISKRKNSNYRVELVATRDILPCEEILVSYGADYHRNDNDGCWNLGSVQMRGYRLRRGEPDPNIHNYGKPGCHNYRLPYAHGEEKEE